MQNPWHISDAFAMREGERQKADQTCIKVKVTRRTDPLSLTYGQVLTETYRQMPEELHVTERATVKSAMILISLEKATVIFQSVLISALIIPHSCFYT